MDHGSMEGMSGMSGMAGMAGMSSTPAPTMTPMNGTLATMPLSQNDAACSMSMLWNWHTINSCFISKSWHIRSNGGFAGTCIAVVFMVMAIELVRRLQRDYDRFLLARWKLRREIGKEFNSYSKEKATATDRLLGRTPISFLGRRRHVDGFMPSFTEQSIRSIFYLLQFAGAYFTMLLAMYYNGYVIICIFIGGYLGNLFFGSDSFLNLGTNGLGENPHCC